MTFVRPAVSKLSAIVIGCLAAALLWCFADVLLFGHVLAFRDTAHYYFPQLRLIADEISTAGCRSGTRLSTPVCRCWPLETRACSTRRCGWHSSVPVSSHSFGRCTSWPTLPWRAGRRIGWGGVLAAGAASGVAALAYAFGGAVLFQYANVVYLVGAAWLPLAILAVERVRSRPTRRDVALLGVTLAMMVLGGDPQLAYHVGIVAALRICLPARASEEGSAVVRRRDAALV